MFLNRRQLLKASCLSVFSAAGLSWAGAARAADTLTIAYNVNLPSWNPTVGVSAVNPTLQGLYRSVFDNFIELSPNVEFQPGLLTAWGWNEARDKVWMDVREGVKWHDGSDFTPADVVWSLERAAIPETGNPIQFIWSKIGNFSVDGNRIEADVLAYEPTLFKWMAFLTAFVLPKDYYERVGADGFESAPIGTGPYKVEKYERNAYVKLVVNEDYWGEKPDIETVICKFIPDAVTRVAEIESGGSDVTFEIPYEELDRLKASSALDGITYPVSDIGMIFLNDIEAMEDINVRLAAHHAINKEAIIKRLLKGYGVAIDTLDTPDYAAYDADVKIDYDPELARELLAKSGYSKDNPVRFTIQTTRGFKPKDYEMIQAIVGMWRKVGIEAEIEVYEIAKHYELRASDQLAPAAFYNWGNAIGDPTTSTGFAMFGPSPHSVWDTDDLDAMIGPLWGESDETKRIDGWKAVNRHIAKNGYVIPLLQYVQPVVFRQGLSVVADASGALRPSLIRRN